MSTILSTLWRVQSHVKDVECLVLDGIAGLQIVVRWSPDEVFVVDTTSNARALMTRSQRLRDELLALGYIDVSC